MEHFVFSVGTVGLTNQVVWDFPSSNKEPVAPLVGTVESPDPTTRMRPAFDGESLCSTFDTFGLADPTVRIDFAR